MCGHRQVAKYWHICSYYIHIVIIPKLRTILNNTGYDWVFNRIFVVMLSQALPASSSCDVITASRSHDSIWPLSWGFFGCDKSSQVAPQHPPSPSPLVSLSSGSWIVLTIAAGFDYMPGHRLHLSSEMPQMAPADGGGNHFTFRSMVGFY